MVGETLDLLPPECPHLQLSAQSMQVSRPIWVFFNLKGTHHEVSPNEPAFDKVRVAKSEWLVESHVFLV